MNKAALKFKDRHVLQRKGHHAYSPFPKVSPNPNHPVLIWTLSLSPKPNIYKASITGPGSTPIWECTTSGSANRCTSRLKRPFYGQPLPVAEKGLFWDYIIFVGPGVAQRMENGVTALRFFCFCLSKVPYICEFFGHPAL